MKLVKILVPLLMVATIGIPATAYCEMAGSKIRETMNGLEQALNAGNKEAMKELYTDNAQIHPAKFNSLENHGDIPLKIPNGQLKTGRGRYRFDVIGLLIEKNTAYLSAVWSATVITDGNHVEIVDGYMTNVLERQPDGGWRITEQSWQ